MKTPLKSTFIALAMIGFDAHAQAPDVSAIPAYKKEFEVVGRLRIAGSELKGVVDLLVEGFKKFHPSAKVSTNFMTSSEGALGMMYAGVSDLAPMGDDAKISDRLPFYNAFGYMPTEVSIATGGYDQRGVLFAWAIIVHKDNPIAHLSMEQLDRIFGAERTGGWEIAASADNNVLYTSKYARGPESNIRKWGQLGLTGEWANKEIQTYGYVAPGFATSFQRAVMHWSVKWNANFKEYVEVKEATNDAAGRVVASQRMYEALEKDKYGIGWGALMHVKGTCGNPDGSKCPGYSGLKVIAISRPANSPAIALTADNVANPSYPLIRDAYVYVDKPPGRTLDPKVREFLRFVLSREGQQIIAKNGPYSPIPVDFMQLPEVGLDVQARGIRARPLRTEACRETARELRQAQADLAHISRVTTMRQLTASLAHEIRQPIGPAINSANACLRWLARERPDLEAGARSRLDLKSVRDVLVRTLQSTSTKVRCNLTSNPRSRVSLADLGLDLTLAVTVTIRSDLRTSESDSQFRPAPAPFAAPIHTSPRTLTPPSQPRRKGSASGVGKNRFQKTAGAGLDGKNEVSDKSKEDAESD